MCKEVEAKKFARFVLFPLPNTSCAFPYHYPFHAGVSLLISPLEDSSISWKSRMFRSRSGILFRSAPSTNRTIQLESSTSRRVL